MIELPLNKNKQTERNQSTAFSNSVTADKVHYLKNNYHKDKMDHKITETIEKEDPSEETFQLTKRWREISKPGDYRFSQGQWRKHKPPRTERSELKRIEMELWQRRNRILWQRMERSNQETQEEMERKGEFYRVIDEIRNLRKKRDEAGPSTSKNTGSVEEETMPELQSEETEIMSSDSDQTIAVPAINFKRYLGKTGMRYIQMGKASKIQNSENWDLEETVRQVEQKFATDLKTIARETTNDEKLLKTLVYLNKEHTNKYLKNTGSTRKTYQRDLESSSMTTKS